MAFKIENLHEVEKNQRLFNVGVYLAVFALDKLPGVNKKLEVLKLTSLRVSRGASSSGMFARERQL